MKRVALSCLLLFALSCKTETEDDGPVLKCDQTTLIDQSGYPSAPIGKATVSQAVVSGNCLKISYSSSGCDGSSWQVQLMTDGTVDLSTVPATRKLKLVLLSQETCTAVINKEKSFDISNLQVSGAQSVALNIENNGQVVVYQY